MRTRGRVFVRKLTRYSFRGGAILAEKRVPQGPFEVSALWRLLFCPRERATRSPSTHRQTDSSALPWKGISRAPPPTTTYHHASSQEPCFALRKRRTVRTTMAPPSYRNCPFCSQLFGSASLPIHIRRCRDRTCIALDACGLAEPSSPTASNPSSPSSPAAPVLLDEAEALAHAHTLKPCCKCGRTFAPDRLAVHERVCLAGRRSRKASSPTPRTPRSRAWERPRPASKWRQQHEELQAIARAHRRRRPSTTARVGSRQRMLLQQMQQSMRTTGAAPWSMPSPIRPASQSAELSCPRSGSPTRRLSAAERHAIEYSRTAEQHEQQQHHHHHHDQHLRYHHHHQQQQQQHQQHQHQHQQTARQQYAYAAHTAQQHLAQARQAFLQQQQQQQQRRQRQQQQLEPLPQRPTTSPGLPSLTRPFRTEASASASMPTSPLRAALDRIARNASPPQWQSPLGTAPQLTQPAVRAVASAATAPTAIPAPACAAPQLARSPSRSTTAYHHCLGSTTTFQGAFYQREVVR